MRENEARKLPSDVDAALQQHAEWVRTGSGDGIVLRQLDLSDVDFPSLPLRGLIFEDCSLERCGLRGLSGPDLRMIRTVLRSCDLKSVELPGLEVRESSLIRCEFEGARLYDALIIDSRIEACNAASIDAVDLSMTRTQVVGSGFRGARLKSAFFHACEFSDVDLGKADLSFAGFGDSELVAVRLDGTVLGRTGFSDCSLKALTGHPVQSASASYTASYRAPDANTGEAASRTFDLQEWLTFQDSLPR